MNLLVIYILTNLNPNFEKSTFLEKTAITKEPVQHNEITTDNQSKNSLWFKFRQGRITASIFKVVSATFLLVCF